MIVLQFFYSYNKGLNLLRPDFFLNILLTYKTDQMRISEEGLFLSPLELTGPEQMAIDLFLLDKSLSEKDFSMAIRFYTWDGHWLSIGKNQKHISKRWINLSKKKKLRIVRRPSGGQAVLHSQGLTYALIWKNPPRNKKESYFKTAEWLINGFKKAGINLNFGNEPAKRQSINCFSNSTVADLVDKKGNKYVGSAQFWKKGHLLQHGEILIEPSKELWIDIFNTAPPKINNLKDKDIIINFLKESMISTWANINWTDYNLEKKELEKINSMINRNSNEFNYL